MWWLQRTTFEELWLELQSDQRYGAIGVLAGIDERGEFIISIAVPRICELVQFG